MARSGAGQSGTSQLPSSGRCPVTQSSALRPALPGHSFQSADFIFSLDKQTKRGASVSHFVMLLLSLAARDPASGPVLPGRAFPV